MPQLRILIVGASIAGNSAAYWFAKAGANVTVIERYPHLRTNGHNVDIRTSAVTIMRKIPGMESSVRSKMLEIDGLSLVRDDGTPYGTIRATGNPDQQSVLSEYEILRGDLAQILFDLTNDNDDVSFIFNEQIASVVDEDTHVSVNFLESSTTKEYDLIVACDGATSRTRAMTFGCGVRDHVTSTNCWAAYFSIKEDLIEKSKVGHGLSSIPGCFMSIEPNSKGGNMIQMIALQNENGPDIVKPLREALKEGDSSLKQHIARYFYGHGWKTEHVLEAMKETDDLYASEISRVKVPSLHRGHLVLVGDAGYAPGFTGTGTTLAITGAYILAGEVCKHKGDLKTALESYEKTMQPILAEMSKLPPLVPTIMAPQTAWGLWLRNNVFAIIAWPGLVEHFSKLAGLFAGDGKEYPLPDYVWPT